MLAKRWLVVVGLGVLNAACSSSHHDTAQPSDERGNLPEESVTTTPVYPGSDTPPTSASEAGGTASYPPQAVLLQELTEQPSRTTPAALTLERHGSFDYVEVRAHVRDVDDLPVTGCQFVEIYRVGQSAVDWPLGGAVSVPLDYGEVLAPGVYYQLVRLYAHYGSLPDAVEIVQSNYFEVRDGGLRPITSAEFSDIVLPVRVGPNGERVIVGSSASPDDEPKPPGCSPPE
jgi:hypothetical protein